MTAFDVQLMQLVYLVSALGVVLFTSFLTRWLWRPLRFLVLSAAISVMFTPFYVEQNMPDGSTQNIVPAFVIMLHDAVNDRENWQTAIQRGGKAILTVAAALGTLSLILALALPKRKDRAHKTVTSPSRNPYLPENPPTPEP